MKTEIESKKVVMVTTFAMLRRHPLFSAEIDREFERLVREVLDRFGAVGGELVREALDPSVAPRTRVRGSTSTMIENEYLGIQQQHNRTALASLQAQHSRVVNTDDPNLETVMALLDAEIMARRNLDQLMREFINGAESRGASKELISSLPVAKITNPEKLPEECRQCNICLEAFEKGEERMMLPCFHGFHNHCASKWLLSNATCPICKHQVNVNTSVLHQS